MKSKLHAGWTSFTMNIARMTKIYRSKLGTMEIFYKHTIFHPKVQDSKLIALDKLSVASQLAAA